jgi:hypothetical protein
MSAPKNKRPRLDMELSSTGVGEKRSPVMYTPPMHVPGILYHCIPVYPELETKMGMVIGQNGKHFKLISHLAGVQYVWYNSVSHAIEVWDVDGSKIDFAANLLIRHMINYLPV